MNEVSMRLDTRRAGPRYPKTSGFASNRQECYGW